MHLLWIYTPGCHPTDCNLTLAKTQLIWLGKRQQLYPNLTFYYWLIGSIFYMYLLFPSSRLRCNPRLLSYLSWSHFDSLLLLSSEATESHKKIKHPYRPATMAHAFICSRIDYCNSLLLDLHMPRLSALQPIINAATRLIARPLRFTHMYITEVLHWLPKLSNIKFRIILFVSKPQLGLAITLAILADNYQLRCCMVRLPHRFQFDFMVITHRYPIWRKEVFSFEMCI